MEMLWNWERNYKTTLDTKAHRTYYRDVMNELFSRKESYMNITKTFKKALAGAAIACAFVLAAAPAPALASTSKAVPVYRVYNPNSGEHVFMTSQNETNATVKAGWTLEGVAWYAPTKDVSGAVPLYRVYNPNANGGDHHYTTNWKEYRSLVNVGWHDEGATFYVNGNISTLSVYRAYNPTPNVAGSHHFTTSWNEIDDIVNAGWRNEGMAFRVINKLDVNKSIVDKAEAFVARYPNGRYPSGLGDGGAKVLPNPNKGNNNNSGTTTKPSQPTPSPQPTKSAYKDVTINKGATINLQDVVSEYTTNKITSQRYMDNGYTDALRISGNNVTAVNYHDESCVGQFAVVAGNWTIWVNIYIRDAAINASGQTITVQNAPDYVTTLHGKSVKLTEQGKRQWVAHKGRTIVGFDFDGSKNLGLDFQSFSENVYGKVTYFSDPKTRVPYQYNRGSAWGACSIEGVSTSFNYQSMLIKQSYLNNDGSASLGTLFVPGVGSFEAHHEAADQAFALYLEEQAVANQSSYWDFEESCGTSRLQYRYTNNVVTSERRVDFTIAEDCGGDYYEYIRRLCLSYNDHTSSKWILSQRWIALTGGANSSSSTIKRQNRYWCVWQDQLR